MTNEIWKDIPEYDGLYQVSNLGRIKSLKRRIWNGVGYFETKEKLLKQYISNKVPYFYCYLKSKNKRRKTEFIHRLVLLTFKGKSDLQCNHINGVKTDNILENLEWVTRKENIKHSWDTGLITKEKQFHKIIPVKQFDLKGNLINQFKSIKEASMKTNICANSIWSVTKKINKTAGGFIWQKNV